MTTGTLNRMRPNWLIAAAGTVLGAALVGGGLLTNALAVHGSAFPFELDGNVTDPAGGQDDWQGVFELNGVTPPGTGTPVATGAEVFIRDLPAGAGSKETMYNAGKDTLDLNGWTRKEVTGVTPDKDNITDAFAKSYMVDHDGVPATPDHRVIYFGADRLANNGDAALGFWFFQKQVALTGTNGFSPNHTVRNVSTGQRGDILVQVDFVSGGSNSQIQIFEWVGSGGNYGPLQEIAFGSANGNTVCLAGDAACATTNETEVGSYWPFKPKFGTSGKFPSESFFEGGIDITALVGDICFNSFLANTRTSHSETADLKDLALGDFNTCGSIDLVRKVCQVPAGQTRPAYDPATEKYTTQHVITIRNDGGGGNIFDVAIRDDAVGGDNSCSIIAISGGSGGYATLPIAIANNTTFYKVANSLAAGVANQMSVTLQCSSPLNPFQNTASVRAGQTPGGTSLTDNYAEVAEDIPTSCVFDAAPSLRLTKACNDPIVLDPSRGFAPKVCVDISLTNNSSPAQTVDVTSFGDLHMDGTSSNLIGNIPLVGTRRPLVAGATVNVKDCYYPTGPDEDQTDPGMAIYSDTVSASGTGRASGTAEALEKSANCPLCPIPAD